MAELEIRLIRYGAPVAQALVAAAMADLNERYGGEDESPVQPVEFDPPEGAFLVAYLNGEPVACGGWRSHPGRREVAELKRMYTIPRVRGQGIARAMLTAVEESARAYGRKRVVLETGQGNPEAVALYTSAGYVTVPHFGFYRDEPDVVSLGREL